MVPVLFRRKKKETRGSKILLYTGFLIIEKFNCTRVEIIIEVGFAGWVILKLLKSYKSDPSCVLLRRRKGEEIKFYYAEVS